MGVTKIVSGAEMKAIEAAANAAGVTYAAMMDAAGNAVAEHILARIASPADEKVVILCGSGNNGGDGLVAAQSADFRGRVKAAGGTVKVAKNKLASLALDGTAAEGIKGLLKGPTILAFSKDPVSAAKTAVAYAKEQPADAKPLTGAIYGGVEGGLTDEADDFIREQLAKYIERTLALPREG